MNINFSNKTALVTGATRGIGFQVAHDLEASGVEKLLLTGTDPDEINHLNKQASSEGSCRHYMSVDFSNKESFRCFANALEQFEKVDVCINNAAMNRPKPLTNVSEDDWQQALAVNLRAPLAITKIVAEKMASHNYGRIVNISSIFGKLSKAGRSMYTITKAGLNGLTVSSSIELAHSNILVNTVLVC